MAQNRHHKVRVLLGLLITLAILYLITNRPLALAVLVVAWWVIFSPLGAAESVMFLVAGVFFLVQNYVTLKAGLFEFRDKDILLMPYYEPALWGFYFLSLKRWVSGTGSDVRSLDWKSVAAVTVTSAMFSLFSGDSRTLLAATACSTTFLFALFHEKHDLHYGLTALVLGFLVELFGVSTGMWSYPAPDFLGIPYWFATMWISVGLLGRRFLIPASGWLAARVMY